jgi:hypothetical protein
MSTLNQRTIITDAQTLVEARIPFVEGVIYPLGVAFDGEGATHCAPVQTFNGWCCDCYLLRKTEDGFEKAPGFEYPVPVRTVDLGEPTGEWFSFH